MLNAGDTQQLTATVSPANAENKSVVWSTSDATIATVDQTWLVTCVTPWNCDITVTTVDGWYTAWCWVTNSWWSPNIHTLLYCPLDSTNGYADITGNHTMQVYSENWDTPAIDSTGFYHFWGWYIASESYTWPSEWTLSMWFKKEYRWPQWDNVEWALSAHRGWSTPYHTFAMDLWVDYAETQWLVYTSNGWTLLVHPWENTLWVWTQWTMTYSATDGMKLYVDWVLAWTQPADWNIYSYNNPTSIWGNNNGSWQWYKWYIADVIYEDKVWSAWEVGIWYNQSKEKYGWQPSSNTICYYPFDNDTLDETGNTSLTISGTITKDTVWYNVTWWALVGAAQLGSTPAFVWWWFYFNSLNQPYCDAMDVNGIWYYVNHLAGHLDKIFYIWNNGTAYHSNSTWIGTWSWHHLCYSVWATNKFYVDWQLFWSDSTQSTTSWTDLTLFNWWGGSTDSSATLSRFIVESVAWTDQEVEDYYNLTKWRYWL